MASWLLPALRAVLPHVGTILDVARPHFTKKSGPSSDPSVLQQQVAELQAAVTQNADNIRELAAQLQQTVAAIEAGAQKAEAGMRLTRALAIAALAAAAAAIAVALLS